MIPQERLEDEIDKMDKYYKDNVKPMLVKTAQTIIKMFDDIDYNKYATIVRMDNRLNSYGLIVRLKNSKDQDVDLGLKLVDYADPRQHYIQEMRLSKTVSSYVHGNIEHVSGMIARLVWHYISYPHSDQPFHVFFEPEYPSTYELWYNKTITMKKSLNYIEDFIKYDMENFLSEIAKSLNKLHEYGSAMEDKMDKQFNDLFEGEQKKDIFDLNITVKLVKRKENKKK